MNLQLFSNTVPQAMAGKDIILAVYNADATKLLAISGQQGLTINRSADSIEITSKDTQGGWKSKIAGMKEWSIDNDGLYAPNSESHTLMAMAFDKNEPVCIKVINGKTQTGMFGGLAVITDYPVEAPYDDAVTYSMSLEGVGALVDLTLYPESPDIMPEGYKTLGSLTLVSLPGTTSGQTMIYVNPVQNSATAYRYKAADKVLLPALNEDCSSLADWNGSTPITAPTGKKLLLVECKDDLAIKAGICTSASK